MTTAGTVAQVARRGRILCLVGRYMFCTVIVVVTLFAH
jgi:hypothetical protein